MDGWRLFGLSRSGGIQLVTVVRCCSEGILLASYGN